MPIIDIEAIGLEPARITHAIVRGTADAIGAVLNVAPGKVWVRVRTLPRSAYAQSGAAAEDTPEPVFVRVLRSRPAVGAELEAQLMAVTRAVASSLGKREQDVHVEFAPPGLGRMALGGRVSQ